MTKPGRKYSFGDVVLAFVQYTDSSDMKIRPAIVLFEEYENIVVAGVTSNPHMQGIKITKEEGMVFDSVIKLNYIMTLSQEQIKKHLFHISADKKNQIKTELFEKIN